MRYVHFITATIVGLLMLPTLIFAEPPSWHISPADSTITFTATQNNAPITGEFKVFSGQIRFDPEQLKDSHVKIRVDTGSVVASYGAVADTLKTSDWFASTLFPQAVFEANEFSKKGPNTYETSGSLTLRDKTLPIVLTFVLEEYSATKARVKGSTMIKRNYFGIGQGEWAKTDEIKDNVQVNFDLVATAE